jgi:hypothetical protein
VSLNLAIAAAIYDVTGGHANGCDHGARIALGAAAGGVAAALVVAVRRVPPLRLTVGLLVAMVLFVAADSGLSTDYLATGGCRYADPAVTEDAISAGWLTFAGGVAVATGIGRRQL